LEEIMMNISLSSCVCFAISFFEEIVTPSLSQTSLQKKIVFVASAALSCLVIYYLLRRYSFKAMLLDDGKNEDENQIENKMQDIQDYLFPYFLRDLVKKENLQVAS
jgi:hypothetical protein